MIARLLAALFACGCTLAASEHGAPPAGAAPLDPAPRTSPSAPLPEDESRLDPQKRLQRRLERLLREHEERIRVLSASGVPGTVRDPIGDPAMEEPLRGRDQALRELRKALQAHVERTPAPRRDELDHPSSRALPGSGADPISARNRLAVAECLRDLAAAPEGVSQDVEDGIAALGGLDSARLSETERALAAYLQVWFLAERARRLPVDAAPERRRKAVDEARAARAALVAQHPASELALTADALVAGLDDGTPLAPGSVK